MASSEKRMREDATLLSLARAYISDDRRGGKLPTSMTSQFPANEAAAQPVRAVPVPVPVPVPVRFWDGVERALQICDFLMRDRDAAAAGSASTSAMSSWRDQPACGAVAMLAVLSGFVCRAKGEDDEDDDYEDGGGWDDSVSDYELLESDDMSEGDLLEDAVSEGEHTIWYGDAQGPTPPTRRRLTVIPDEEDVSVIMVEDEEEH
ncbi:hypothetical protein EKO27_g7839 [Xylaria grammica]|uniref:Uncharacterized protein n=1 Tax=Xylaria grammica TaxID=363999 RepID=A0A439CZ02_9PEZI|nr:hypothetical protein EKO27_g7839 [Xylaria grammica]